MHPPNKNTFHRAVQQAELAAKKAPQQLAQQAKQEEMDLKAEQRVGQRAEEERESMSTELQRLKALQKVPV